jgi:hypothetical protein
LSMESNPGPVSFGSQPDHFQSLCRLCVVGY